MKELEKEREREKKMRLTRRVYRAKKNLILGHELVGRVVAVGQGEKRWKEGDRVGAGWHGGHDGTCRSCNRGLFQCCENAKVNGVYRDGGCEFSLHARPSGTRLSLWS